MQLENKAFLTARVKRFGYLCFGAYAAILLHLTLFSHNYYTYGRSANLDLFKSIRLMVDSGNFQLFFDNVVGNILLFLPFGFLLTLLIKKLRNLFLMFAVAIVTSFSIEIAQYEFANRIFDIDDIFLNVVGAMVGWMAVKLVIMAVKRRKG
ncbi:MAG TPA: VanZ family protein [Bacillales bacterium]|nr:VanZ family protein [Bacillales bacterium]